jgi:hypothetical protein
MIDFFAACVLATACTIPGIALVAFWWEWQIIQKKRRNDNG